MLAVFCALRRRCGAADVMQLKALRNFLLRCPAHATIDDFDSRTEQVEEGNINICLRKALHRFKTKPHAWRTWLVNFTSVQSLFAISKSLEAFCKRLIRPLTAFRIFATNEQFSSAM